MIIFIKLKKIMMKLKLPEPPEALCVRALRNINNNDKNNRTQLLVGPSFCCKTHLLLNKLQLIRLDDPLRQIRIITRSPEQYKGFQLEGVSVEENVGGLEMYRGVV